LTTIPLLKEARLQAQVLCYAARRLEIMEEQNLYALTPNSKPYKKKDFEKKQRFLNEAVVWFHKKKNRLSPILKPHWDSGPVFLLKKSFNEKDGAIENGPPKEFRASDPFTAILQSGAEYFCDDRARGLLFAQIDNALFDEQPTKRIFPLEELPSQHRSKRYSSLQDMADDLFPDLNPEPARKALFRKRIKGFKVYGSPGKAGFYVYDKRDLKKILNKKHA